MSEVIDTPIPTFETLPERIHGQLEPLTRNERSVYYCLKAAKGRIVSRWSLYDALYGAKPDCDQPDDKIIRVIICYTRRKLPKAQIKTHWGLGYSLEQEK